MTESDICGIKAKWRKELLKHMKGERLTFRQAILARCYECMNGYTDGKYGCGIPGCPLYPFMPYRDLANEPNPFKEQQNAKR